MNNKLSILFFEPEMAGHQPEYIRHIYNYPLEKSLDIAITFIVHPDFLQSFPDITTNLRNQSNPQISFMPLRQNEFVSCMHRSLAVRSFLRWKEMLKYMERVSAHHGCALYLDHLQLPPALQCKPKNGATVSGILFRPSIHYGVFGQKRSGVKEAIVNTRKRILYYGLMRNKALRIIFSLDPYFPAYARSHIGKTNKTVALPDPQNQTQITAEESSEFVSLVKKVAEKRKIFLLFGALQRRKGILKTLDSLQYIDKRILGKVAVIFAGRVEADIRDQFYSAFNAVSATHCQCKIHVEDRFISDGELNSVISFSQVILAPYQRFPGSSGLLIAAARANIPVITQDYGLLGAYTREFGLGLAIDTTKPQEIAKAITSFVNDEGDGLYSKEGMNSFLSGRTPEAFAKTIFGNIMKSCL